MRRLLIRPGAIGDCILSFPALEYLKTDYTEVWISSAVVPLVTFADKVRAISSTGLDLAGVGDIDTPEKLASELRSFDSVVSWYGSAREEFREAMRRIGSRFDFHAALPPSEYRGHAVDFFARQVGAQQGLAPHIGVNRAASRDSVVIHPFSGGARKNWPLAHFRELALRLPLSIEWSAGPEELLPEAVRFDNLEALASWMSGSRLYIGNDSGVTHLAAAVGIPVIALFGPTSPETWAPRGENVTVIRSQPIEKLPVEMVLDAATRKFVTTTSLRSWLGKLL
jgi:heptosyltransferase III